MSRATSSCPGFPVLLEDAEGPLWACNPAVGLIDSDEQLDIVIVSDNSATGTHVMHPRAFTSEGQLIWQLELPGWSGDPAVGDLDNDGQDEVAIVSCAGVHIIDDGVITVDHQWGIDWSHSNPSLADMDGDGDLEVIFYYAGMGMVYCMHHDGSMLFSHSTEVYIHNPMVGDIDSDGSLDIVYNRSDGVMAIDANGNPKPGFPMPTHYFSRGGPVIDDLDRDGRVEIIATASSTNSTGQPVYGTVFNWELAGDYDPAHMPWPRFRHDNRHSGYYDGLPPYACDIDLGDAPDPSYPSLAASLGASHVLGGGLYLGSCVDADADALPNTDATGDDQDTGGPVFGICSDGDDEDGVVLPATLLPGGTAEIAVTASAACTLSAWLDSDADGTWSDAEALFPDGQPLVAGINNLSVPIPATAVAGNSFARFRCTSEGVTQPTGRAADGEVEDYRVVIAGSPGLSLSMVVTITSLGDDDFQVVYTMTLSNEGDVQLLDLQLNDDLSVVFTDAAGFSDLVPSSADLTLNPAYNGSTDTNLLAGTDSLAVAGSVTVELALILSSGWHAGPYTNTTAAAAIGAGMPVSAAGAATFSLDLDASLGADKSVSLTDLGYGDYRVVYTITLSNDGDVPLDDLQISDDLSAVFASVAGFSDVVLSSDDLALNPAYDGSADIALLAGTDSLGAGASATVELALTLSSGSFAGPYTNTAQVSASGAGSTVAVSAEAAFTLAQQAIPVLGVPGMVVLFLALMALALHHLRRLG